MTLIAAHLNAEVILVLTVAIGIQTPSAPIFIPLPPSPFSPSLISLMVSVDFKHNVYLSVASVIRLGLAVTR